MRNKERVMKGLTVLCAAVCLVAAGCSKDSSPSSPTTPTNPTFTATLSPANEVNAVQGGETSGSGNGTFTMVLSKDAAGNVTSATATFVATLTGFPAGTTINLMHIHQGAPGCQCPVVVNSNIAAGQVLASGSGSITASNQPVTAEIAQGIMNNPAGFYLNVHSAINGGGVARGQLTRVQ
jgi:CHRD domain